MTTPATIAGRVPPNDVELEAALLSTLILHPDGIDQVADLFRPEHMFSPDHREIAQVLYELVEQGVAVDIVSVSTRLRAKAIAAGGQQFDVRALARLCDEAYTTQPRPAAERLHTLWRQRRALALLHRHLAEGYAEQADPGAWMSSLEQDVFELLETSSQHRRSASFGDCMSEIMTKMASGAPPGIPAGYRVLDATTGGWHRGDLTVLGARPGAGKSALALDLAIAVAQTGHGALLWSGEMPKDQIGLRGLVGHAHVNLATARQRPGYLTDRDWQELAQAGQSLAPIPLWVNDSASMTLVELASAVRGAARECRRRSTTEAPCEMALVVVDYLQLLSATAENRTQEIGKISRGLKRLAKAHNVAVLALSQLNRGVETRGGEPRPMLKDLRESGDVEADADNIWFLYRPGYYLEQAHKVDDTDGRTELAIAKHRNGPTRVIELRFEAASARFERG